MVFYFSIVFCCFKHSYKFIFYIFIVQKIVVILLSYFFNYKVEGEGGNQPTNQKVHDAPQSTNQAINIIRKENIKLKDNKR